MLFELLSESSDREVDVEIALYAAASFILDAEFAILDHQLRAQKAVFWSVRMEDGTLFHAKGTPPLTRPVLAHRVSDKPTLMGPRTDVRDADLEIPGSLLSKV